jgi:hypothetical protein
MDKTNKITLWYVCYSLLCSTAFASFRQPLSKRDGRSPAAKPPSASVSISKNPSSPDIPARFVNRSTIKSITRLELWRIKKPVLQDKQLREPVTALTQPLITDEQSIRLTDLEDFNEQLFDGSRLSLQELSDAMDLSRIVYFMNPTKKFKQGTGRIIFNCLNKDGIHPKNNAFSLENISTVLAANNLSGILDGVPAENQAAAKIHIFLKHCLSRSNFIQITIDCDRAGNPARDREGRIQWAFVFYANLGQTIGVYHGTLAQCVKIVFRPVYSEHRMQFATANPIPKNQFENAFNGDLFYWRMLTKKD